MLRVLFDSYALMNNRMTTDTIQSQKYHKIMRDAAIYNGSHTSSEKEMKQRVDLIFCSINRNKSNMDFEHFLQSLVKVAEAKYGNS